VRKEKKPRYVKKKSVFSKVNPWGPTLMGGGGNGRTLSLAGGEGDGVKEGLQRCWSQGQVPGKNSKSNCKRGGRATEGSRKHVKRGQAKVPKDKKKGKKPGKGGGLLNPTPRDGGKTSH